MTVQWGAWEDASGNGMRSGIQIESQTTPTNGSTTFVVTFTVWTQNRAAYSDAQTFDLTASLGSLSSSSVAYTNNSGTTATQRGGSLTVTYTYSTYGTSPGTITINGTVNGTYNGVTPNSSASVTIPARPWANPASPTLLTNTRVSDTQASLAWTNNSTAAALYSGTRVQRQTDGGAWTSIATPGVVTSYSDTTVVANHKYNHRVSALGANGSEVGYATGTAYWTTPGAPSTCTASKNGAGNIDISWTNTVNYAEYSTEIYHSTDGGTNWTLLTTVATGIATYTHTTPGTGTSHTYKVRAKTTSGTALFSSYSPNSGTIVTLSTANAPVGLSPSGVARDAAGAIVFTWTHNPTDGTPQSKYQLQYKVDAGAYTTVGPTTSAVSSYTLAAATLTNAHTITWHVATAGENGTLSAYSSDATFTTSAVPTATISAPTSSYGSSALTVTWSYFQAQSSAQATWQASLYDGVGTLLETVSGTTATAAVFATPLANSGSYSVTVTVTSAAGLSGSATQAFTVTYLPPADVTVSPVYDSGSGAMVLTLTGADPVGGVTVAISAVDVQRQIDGGAWVTIATGLVLAGDPKTAVVLDTRPTIAGTNAYRAVAYSATPTSATSATANGVTAEKGWAFLSTGDGFATVVRLKAAPKFASSAARQRVVYHFAGRAKPVQLTGDATDLVLTVSGDLLDTSSAVSEFEAMARTADVVLWRDPTGRRVFGAIGQVQTDTESRVSTRVSFTVSEVDYAE